MTVQFETEVFMDKLATLGFGGQKLGPKGEGQRKFSSYWGSDACQKIFYVDWELGKKYVNGEGLV